MEKQINEVIDYIIKCDMEIPKIITTLSNLLPDEKMAKNIRKLLEKGDNDDR